ncbi:MAG: hypothetical protein AB1861_03365 [Cyanobacteriota bacterium]
MNLSYKDTQFIIEALEYRIKAYQERLKEVEDSDEDEASDISNDLGFLEALCRDLAKTLKENIDRAKVLHLSDSHFSEVKDTSGAELEKIFFPLIGDAKGTFDTKNTYWKLIQTLVLLNLKVESSPQAQESQNMF